MRTATYDPTTSRRALLAPAAVLSAPLAAVPALAAVTAPSDADAALLALGREYGKCFAACKVEWDAEWAAHRRYEATRPDALLERPSDQEAGFPAANGEPEDNGLPPGSPHYYVGWTIWQIEDDLSEGKLPAESRARAEEILAASKRYEAEDRAAERAAGYSDDDDPEQEELYNDLWNLQADIAFAPALTTAGVMLKARVAADVALRDQGGILPLADLDTALEHAGKSHGYGTDVTLALSVVCDLIRLNGSAA